MTYSPILESNNVKIFSIAYDSTISTFGYLYVVDGSTSPITLTIDPVSAVNTGSLFILKSDNTNNVIMINTASGYTINGQSSFVLVKQYNSIHVVCDGTPDIKILSSTLGAPSVHSVPSTLVLRDPNSDVNLRNVNTNIVSSGVDATLGDHLPRLSQVQSMLPVSISNVDNSSIYLNGSNQLAIKALGVTDSMVSNSSSIVKSHTPSAAYTAGQIVSKIGFLWQSLVNTSATPSLASTVWMPIAGVVSGRESYASVYQNTNYTATEADCFIYMDCQVSPLTLTMTSMSNFTGAGVASVIPVINVIKCDSINNLTITLTGVEAFIDGTSSITISSQGALVRLFVLKDLNKWLVKAI